MSLFIGLHTLPLPEGVKDNWEGYKKSCADLGIRAIHAYSSDEKGVAYCITDASSAEEVLRAHKNADVPVDDVFEVNRAD